MIFQCALIQMAFEADKAVNLQKATTHISAAAKEGAEIVCFPELASTIYFPFELQDRYRALADPIPGETTEIIGRAACAAKTSVVFPLYERGCDGNLYNSAVLINPAGKVAGVYRKTSIPMYASDEMNGLEKFYFRPGNLGFPVFEVRGGMRAGIVICYDRHFPEGPRSLALGGADVIFVPAAAGPPSRHVWDVELRTHAFENSVWVAGVNRVGRDEGGSSIEFFGSSLFCDPTGGIVAQAPDDREAIIHAQIDTDLNRTVREEWGFFRDRRPETYDSIVKA